MSGTTQFSKRTVGLVESVPPISRKELVCFGNQSQLIVSMLKRSSHEKRRNFAGVLLVRKKFINARNPHCQWAFPVHFRQFPRILFSWIALLVAVFGISMGMSMSIFISLLEVCSLVTLT